MLVIVVTTMGWLDAPTPSPKMLLYNSVFYATRQRLHNDFVTMRALDAIFSTLKSIVVANLRLPYLSEDISRVFTFNVYGNIKRTVVAKWT